MPYTLAKAAEATGLNRSTVLRAIKGGRVSGTRDQNGTWLVEPIELHRVFPPAEPKASALPQHAHPDIELRVRLQVAEERLGELKHALADMTRQRDGWQQQAERLSIAAQARPTSVPTVTVQARPWWRRLAG